MEHRNDAGTVYCLGLIAGEAGEVSDVVGQALRFGLDTPSEPEAVRTAGERLEQELGDIVAAMRFGAAHNIVDLDEVERYARNKLAKLRRGVDNLGRPLAPPPETWP